MLVLKGSAQQVEIAGVVGLPPRAEVPSQIGPKTADAVRTNHASLGFRRASRRCLPNTSEGSAPPATEAARHMAGQHNKRMAALFALESYRWPAALPRSRCKRLSSYSAPAISAVFIRGGVSRLQPDLYPATETIDHSPFRARQGIAAPRTILLPNAPGAGSDLTAIKRLPALLTTAFAPPVTLIVPALPRAIDLRSVPLSEVCLAGGASNNGCHLVNYTTSWYGCHFERGWSQWLFRHLERG